MDADDLNSSSFFQNTRLLLSLLEEDSGTPATSSGNLNRDFVGKMFSRMVLHKPFLDSVIFASRVKKEKDIWPLHIVRVVSEVSRVVVRRRGRFQLTRAGRELLHESKAGALFRRIFIGYLRDFDLRYDFQLRDVPGIQQSMTVILWRLDTIARDWIPVKGLAPQVLLPGVLMQLHETMIPPHDTEGWILASYVLDPLFDLGLIERRPQSKWPAITEENAIRVSALWRKFIRFDPRLADFRK